MLYALLIELCLVLSRKKVFGSCCSSSSSSHFKNMGDHRCKDNFSQLSISIILWKHTVDKLSCNILHRHTISQILTWSNVTSAHKFDRCRRLAVTNCVVFCTENSWATCPPFPHSTRLGGLFCLSSQPMFVTESTQRQAADAFLLGSLSSEAARRGIVNIKRVWYLQLEIGKARARWGVVKSVVVV